MRENTLKEGKARKERDMTRLWSRVSLEGPTPFVWFWQSFTSGVGVQYVEAVQTLEKPYYLHRTDSVPLRHEENPLVM